MELSDERSDCRSAGVGLRLNIVPKDGGNTFPEQCTLIGNSAATTTGKLTIAGDPAN